jgi:hypothetical protein
VHYTVYKRHFQKTQICLAGQTKTLGRTKIFFCGLVCSTMQFYVCVNCTRTSLGTSHRLAHTRCRNLVQLRTSETSLESKAQPGSCTRQFSQNCEACQVNLASSLWQKVFSKHGLACHPPHFASPGYSRRQVLVCSA